MQIARLPKAEPRCSPAGGLVCTDNLLPITLLGKGFCAMLHICNGCTIVGVNCLWVHRSRYAIHALRLWPLFLGEGSGVRKPILHMYNSD